jgi:hypothetical protein
MSKKALLVLGAAVAALVIPASAAALYSLLDFQSATDALSSIDPTIDPPPNDPSKDFAVGGFTGLDNNKVGFSAHSGPLGQDAQGKLSETIPLFAGPGQTYQGRFTITCLAVAGLNASMGLVPTGAASNDQQGQFWFIVHDSGLPGGAGDQEGFIGAVPADECTAGLAFADELPPIGNGNILVNDAAP